jgi:DNA-binding NtrC family response regulator
MNPHRVIADSDESAVVGPDSNPNQADSSPGEVVLPVEPSASQVTPSRDEPDESEKCLTIERPASDPGQASVDVIRGGAGAGALGEASPKTTAAVAQEQAEAAWPLTLDEMIKQTLIRLLRETAGNRRRTASLLGISRSTLYRMLARYGIDHVGRTATARKRGVNPSEPSA